MRTHALPGLRKDSEEGVIQYQGAREDERGQGGWAHITEGLKATVNSSTEFRGPWRGATDFSMR